MRGKVHSNSLIIQDLQFFQRFAAQGRAKVANRRYIFNRIIELEAEKVELASELAQATGNLALQLRSHVVAVERQLYWLRGRWKAGCRRQGKTYAEERAHHQGHRDALIGAVGRNPAVVTLPQPDHLDRGRRPDDLPYFDPTGEWQGL